MIFRSVCHDDEEVVLILEFVPILEFVQGSLLQCLELGPYVKVLKKNIL